MIKHNSQIVQGLVNETSKSFFKNFFFNIALFEQKIEKVYSKK